VTTDSLSIVPGSITDMATRNGGHVTPPALCVLFDTSSSMLDMDGKLGDGTVVSRWHAGVEQLTKLQGQYPGQIVLIEFGDTAAVRPGGAPGEPRGLTRIYPALQLAKQLDTGVMRFVVISDGMPQDEHAAVDFATTFSVGIDTIAIGDANNGVDFLQRLARETGGTYHRDHSGLALLGQTIRALLPGGVAGTGTITPSES